ncbi:MAG: response regulator [Clostridiales bacterium]|jgi:two-component system response regulator YesN|nr:response regulator [Clostridiales bacterium]
MYTVLIADDERIVIDSLNYIINKNFGNEFEIISARSGREALLIAQSKKIDIAFIDISMPGINGIQAIERMKETDPDIIFVILTAFDKFDFAKTALQLGVAQYLLKPIKREQIIEIVSEMRKRVAKRNKSRIEELEIFERLEKANLMLETELVESVISPPAKPNELDKRMSILGVSAIRGFLLLIEFDEPFLSRNGMSIARSDVAGGEYYCVREQIKAVGDCLVGALSDGRLAAIRLLADDCGNELIFPDAEAIKKRLAEHAKAFVKIGASNYINGIDKAAEAYTSAVLALRFATAKTPVVCYDEIKHRRAEEGKMLDRCGINQPIQQTIAYINRHYERKLTLNLLADMVGISPNYFSKLFKEEAGVSFIEYLTQVRMAKAKALLAEKKKSIKEISIETGYRDSAYFTRSFKKFTGVVPTDYISSD